MIWDDYMRIRAKGLEPFTPWHLHDKVKCYDFLEALNIPTSKILRRFASPRDIDLSGLPETFVLKPTLESSLRGVMVLTKTGDEDLFTESLTNKQLTLSEIVEIQDSLFSKNSNKANQLIVEQVIQDCDGLEVPRDFKAYAFRGEIAAFVVIDRNHRTAHVGRYDECFRLLDKSSLVQEKPSPPPQLPDSETLEALTCLARKTSLVVPAPFSRIDLYATPSGPVVGEITLVPGGYFPKNNRLRLSDDFQAAMGAMWSRAQSNMEATYDAVARRIYGKHLAACTYEEDRSIRRDLKLHGTPLI